ncbi:NAD-dependent epimerase/dehydratase family protein [Arenibacter sp. 6A1]|uniref:NAD-dependent epimerase/dehydratase family protein n=1 Tax=Arenibacter sp. 6A1 TaxID=2720391 RepID=UPI0014459FD0|nr:NAD-dependent epimerase/dehydratase family protein [Arenibacter sp. 6A1]NKI26147.1 NAD-dependent epimerase/dehydratase family protein [Arenibacter sp. 6A1]
MILVTGGTGLVGAHLLLQLVQSGATVKAIHRKTSDLKGVEKIFGYYTPNAHILFKQIQWIEAELSDIPALELAFEKVSRVYHCAALISFDPKDYELLKKVNHEGTKNIVNLCIANNVKKLCYVSSIATIGKTPNHQSAHEETDWHDQNASVYALTKMDAELEVWRGSQENIPVVIVNPGVILGPGYWNSGSGQFFKTAYKGQKYYPPGGTGFVGIQDVVRLMVQLMNSSITNQRFIAVAENASYKEILDKISKGLMKPGPTKKIALWQLEILWRLDWLRSLLTQKGRKLSKNKVNSLRKHQLYNNDKAKEQLDFSFEPLTETIKFSCEKFLEEQA